MIQRYPDAQDWVRRVLNQALRELLLAQSSDWAFIMNNNTAVEYAERRTREHLYNLRQLYLLLGSTLPGAGMSPDLENLLIDLESKNNLFPKIDYRVFR
jgi:1,4-alpha-glucan branching enzyme